MTAAFQGCFAKSKFSPVLYPMLYEANDVIIGTN